MDQILGLTYLAKEALLMLRKNPGSKMKQSGSVVHHVAVSRKLKGHCTQDNILFGSPYDEERYRKVIYQCGLERDLELFEAGDQTEVGEKGLTLSGGQKARVTLARAIYSPAQIVLLDDVLAALE